MSYYNQQQAPVGAPPSQYGYAPQGYPQQGYPPQGYPPQGYPPQGYPPQQQGMSAQGPYSQNRSGPSSCLEACLAALCCCALLDICC